MIALDCAAAEFYQMKKYDYSKFEGETVKLDLLQNKNYLAELAAKYPNFKKTEWMK
jgi:enolase